MREIAPDEAYRLYDCLEQLAEHHNRVSVHFKGQYPLTPSADEIRQFEQELSEGSSRIAVAENGRSVAGFCKISFDGDAGTLEYLVVLEPERGKGYGGALMDWAMESFRERGVRYIDVKVVYGNDAVGLYE